VVAVNAEAPLLEVEHLAVVIPTSRGDVHAVRDISFTLRRGEHVALLGESGSGKTMLAMTLLGLQPGHAKITGTVKMNGQVVPLGDEAGTDAVVRRLSNVVFQDSLSALNPTRRIGRQLTEVLRLRGVGRAKAVAEAQDMLARVGLTDVKKRMKAYPHELSGGMRQRVMIAMALLARPALLFADEPTTALDVTVQAQVVELIKEIQAETGLALLLITHDIGLAAEVAERALVMYAGRLVEDGPMEDTVRNALHPYTSALIASTPRMDSDRELPLVTIDGEPPAPVADLPGCHFYDRCPIRMDACATGDLQMRSPSPNRVARCVRVQDNLPVAVGAESS
jgi:peptide/nickel transport system ATP-binding protein